MKNDVVLSFMQKPISILKSVFGYDQFRENQLEIIEHTLSGQDGLAIMPTGGGKSICYQIPAIIFPNVTIVISPLISLMKDQVESLRANGVEVAYYNSSMSDSARNVIRNRALQNDLKLLYLSPETLIGGLDWIKSIPVSMIAIDEAHCVSMWGHDFRPEYQQIGELRKHFSNVPFAAFTATADKITRKDIKEKLALNAPAVFISSFDRPNLSLEVRSQIPKKQKEIEYVQFIKNRPDDSGIIYCLSRKETEAWSETLNNNGIPSKYYHAGLSNNERDAVQEGFIQDDYQVICATIAFGMGIDKSNVRWVIHNNLPKNVESYYQEIGRAGRDGLPSETILYYNYRDVVLQNDFIKDSSLQDVYKEKINRMLQYAEATSCRRRILLAYFGEHSQENCNNCDVCANPPEFIPGTVISQKALSAAIRGKEKLGMNLMIAVLRGSKIMEVFEKGLEKIKTYGVGAEFSFKQWQHYLNQMINQGLFEIAYDEGMHLKVSEMGKVVLQGQLEVELTEFVERELKTKKKTSKDSAVDSDLLGLLKDWRKQKAQENSVPAYVILHDATLQELASQLPTELSQLAQIQGLGKVKIDRFGQELIQIIVSKGKNKLDTYSKTLQLYDSGMNLEEIASSRGLSEQTVINHLIKLYEDGNKIDLHQYVSEYEMQQVRFARKALNNTYQLKPIFDKLEGAISYPKISMAIAILDHHSLRQN